MNFNFLILLFLLTGCGVKGNPRAPEGNNVPSVLENYPDIETDVPLDESKKL